jgi:AcrR family transcriptional regulator
LLTEGGLSAVTIEGIAARAGVGKPTIYRSWPNAQAVAMAALMEREPTNADRPLAADAGHSPPEPAGSSSALASLRNQLREIARVFSTPMGRNVTLMIASAERETELSKVFRNHFILARRNEGREWLEQAMSRGELRRDLDVDVALDLIYSPIFYRLLMGHAPLNEAFTDAVIAHVLEGLAPVGARPDRRAHRATR